MITHDPTPDPSRDDAVQWIMHALTPMLRPGVNEDGRLQLPGDGELATARRLFGQIIAALEEAEATVAQLRDKTAECERLTWTLEFTEGLHRAMRISSIEMQNADLKRQLDKLDAELDAAHQPSETP